MEERKEFFVDWESQKDVVPGFEHVIFMITPDAIDQLKREYFEAGRTSSQSFEDYEAQAKHKRENPSLWR